MRTRRDRKQRARARRVELEAARRGEARRKRWRAGVAPEGFPIPDAPPLVGDDYGSGGPPVDGIECQGAE